MHRHTILIVCSGNMFRSPVAAYCLRRALNDDGLGDLIEVTSRGIQGLKGIDPTTEGKKNIRDYPVEWGNAEPALMRYGINIDDHRSTVVTEDILTQASLVLAVEWGVLITRPNSLVRSFPGHVWKMRLFTEIDGRCNDIQDTANTDTATYERVTELIDSTARRGTRYIMQWITNIHNQTQNQTGEKQ